MNKKFCTECGSEVTGNFCTNCGKTLEDFQKEKKSYTIDGISKVINDVSKNIEVGKVKNTFEIETIVVKVISGLYIVLSLIYALLIFGCFAFVSRLENISENHYLMSIPYWNAQVENLGAIRIFMYLIAVYFVIALIFNIILTVNGFKIRHLYSLEKNCRISIVWSIIHTVLAVVFIIASILADYEFGIFFVVPLIYWVYTYFWKKYMNKKE